jgi:hypothetical protein
MWVDGRELTDDEIKDRMKEMKLKLKNFDDMGNSFRWTGPDANLFMSPGTRSRGRLGVRVDELDKDMAEALGVTSGKGALVREVLQDTPAQKAGLRAGDVIVRVGGDPVDDTDDLTRALRDRQGKVSIEVLRRGKPAHRGCGYPQPGGGEPQSHAILGTRLGVLGVLEIEGRRRQRRRPSARDRGPQEMRSRSSATRSRPRSSSPRKSSRRDRAPSGVPSDASPRCQGSPGRRLGGASFHPAVTERCQHGAK